MNTMIDYDELHRMNKEKQFYSEERVNSLCEKFKVHKDIVESYIGLFLAPNKHYHSNLMCGTGKTMGLAIALASSQTSKIVYVANNHERLDDFESKLRACSKQITIAHIRSSEELVDKLNSIKVILLTSSMLLQVIPYRLNRLRTGQFGERLLVMDEFPDLIHKFRYEGVSIGSFKSYLDTRFFSDFNQEELDYKLTPFDPKIYDHICKIFGEGGLDSDLAINVKKTTIEEDRVYNDFIVKLYLLNPILKNARLEDTEYGIYYYSIKEIYFDRFEKSIILDATSSMYQELLETTHYKLGNEDEYNRYVESSFKICSINNSLQEFTDKQFRIKNFVLLLKLLKNTFNELTEGATYVVTNNDCLYEENDDIKEDVLNYLKSIYKVVYKEPNKNFILCTNREVDLDNIEPNSGDLFLANYNRNRGTNIFRKCKYVFLLGEFRLPDEEIKGLIDARFQDLDYKKLTDNLSIADAVQELSRGCLRTRDLENKESIFLLGKEDWIQGILKYMKIESNIFNLDLKIQNENIVKYLLENSENIRKSSYCYLCNLLIKYNFKLPYSVIEEEIRSGNLPIYLKQWSRLSQFFNEIGIDDPNSVLTWD